MTALSGPPILVIKLGALGDVVQATGPFAAIRRHHAASPVTLLTTRPFAGFLAASPWFDRVEVDPRAAWWDLAGQRRLAAHLRGGGYARVYDLQTSRRSSRYLRLFPRRARPEWSGIARGASHPDADPDRDRLHTLERQVGQLWFAGIAAVPPPDLGWVPDGSLPVAPPFALLVPGGSAHRPAKRWPHFAALATGLANRGLTPVWLGGTAEAELTARLAAAVPGSVDLAGRTDLADLVRLGRAASVAVGNDTGPMHVLAVAGAPALVLFSADSDPALCAPRGDRVRILREPRLADLPAARVLDAVLSIVPSVSPAA